MKESEFAFIRRVVDARRRITLGFAKTRTQVQRLSAPQSLEKPVHDTSSTDALRVWASRETPWPMRALNTRRVRVLTVEPEVEGVDAVVGPLAAHDQTKERTPDSLTLDLETPRRRGTRATTFAQHEHVSIVDGAPGAAGENGAAQCHLPLDRVADAPIHRQESAVAPLLTSAHA